MINPQNDFKFYSIVNFSNISSKLAELSRKDHKTWGIYKGFLQDIKDQLTVINSQIELALQQPTIPKINQIFNRKNLEVCNEKVITREEIDVAAIDRNETHVDSPKNKILELEEMEVSVRREKENSVASDKPPERRNDSLIDLKPASFSLDETRLIGKIGNPLEETSKPTEEKEANFTTTPPKKNFGASVKSNSPIDNSLSSIKDRKVFIIEIQEGKFFGEVSGSQNSLEFPYLEIELSPIVPFENSVKKGSSKPPSNKVRE